MMLTKIVSRLVPQDFKPGTERKGEILYCATTSHGHNSEKKKTKLSNEPQKEGLNCLLYKARKIVTVQEAQEKAFKDTLRSTNQKMELANTSAITVI